jgi:hypothetical protein
MPTSTACWPPASARNEAECAQLAAMADMARAARAEIRKIVERAQ